MSIPIEQKSSVEEIKVRFDNDVERFSNLETGQTSTIDAPLAMDLIAQAASKSSKNIQRVLDIGCGAGNSTIKLAQQKNYDYLEIVGFNHKKRKIIKQTESLILNTWKHYVYLIILMIEYSCPR